MRMHTWIFCMEKRFAWTTKIMGQLVNYDYGCPQVTDRIEQ